MKAEPRQPRTAPGAYGFRISGLNDGTTLLAQVPADWPSLRIERVLGSVETPKPARTLRITDEYAELWFPAGDRIELLREPLTVRITSRDPVRAETIAHPYLGLPAAIANRWLGRLAFHGGAFANQGRAWALLGARKAGKSATLGQLMRAGHPIVCDDVLIIDGTTLFAGPRSVDLRQDAAALLGGQELGVVGNRTRWRLRPGPSAPELPLAGLVLLEWGDSVRLEPMDAEERFRALIASSAFAPQREASVAYLELVALPSWRYVRPANIGQIKAQTDQLVASLSI